MKKSTLFKLLSLYPPYLGAGIRVRSIAPDFTSIQVEMKLRFWNRNYVGTHFGGSLFSMTDPFFMLILIEHLGPNYTVWDKAATIRFKKPGRGRVEALFQIPLSEINEIRTLVDQNGKYEPHFIVQIRNDDGELVAEVEKIISVKLKGNPSKS